MDVRVRRASDADVGGVVDVLIALAAEESRDAVPRERLAALVTANLASPTHAVFVAVDGERVVGYVAVHWIPFALMGGWEAYVSDLVVDGRARGGQVGSRLLAAVEAEARQRGCTRVMLNNRMASQAFARGFYPTRGFVQRTEWANFVKRLD